MRWKQQRHAEEEGRQDARMTLVHWWALHPTALRLSPLHALVLWMLQPSLRLPPRQDAETSQDERGRVPSSRLRLF